MTETLPQVKVFVIGPIGDRDEPHGSPRRNVYEEGIQILDQIIEPACTALGLEVLRADQITRTGEIPEQIFRQIRDAHIVIADLTGANPNVMYELGLRHTTGKLTIQIGERERLPFDVSAIRTIMFRRTEGGLVEARRLLIQALATGLESGGDPVAATRIWFEQAESKINYEEQIDGEDDEPGFLEKLADSEEGIVAITQSLQTVTSISSEITTIFIKETSGVKNQNATKKLIVANRMAALLEDPANRLHIAITEYSRIIDRIEPGITYLLNIIADEKDQAAEARELLEPISSFINSVQNMINAALEAREDIDQLGKSTRSMRQVISHIKKSLQSFVDSSRRISNNWRILLEQVSLSAN